MATVFTQDAVLHFLQSSGGSVKNADLLLHFTNFIREHPDRDKNRELFKKFVNTVATVKQVDGVSYVVLRKTFKENVPGGGEQRPRLWNPEGPGGNVTYSPAGGADKARQNPPPGAVTVPTAGPSGKGVLPAAGIILNNVETNLKQKQVTNKPEVSVRSAAVAARVVSETLSMSEPPGQHQLTKVGRHRRSPGPPPDVTPVVTAVRHNADLSLQVPLPGPQRGQTPGRVTCQDSEGVLHQYIPPDTVSPHPQVEARRRYRQSYKSAVSYDEDDDEGNSPVRRHPAGAWPGSVPLGNVGKNISASSPSIINSPAPSSLLSSSSSGRFPEICIHNVKGKKLPTAGLDRNSESGRRGQWTESGLEPGPVPWEFLSNRRSLPLEAECSVPVHVREVVPQLSVQSGETYLQPASVPLKPRLNPDHIQRTWLSSSQSSIFTPSPDAGISSRGWNSSCEDLQARPGKTGGDFRTGQSDHLLDNRGPTARVLPWHQSAGDLHDDHDEAESGDSSIFSPPLRQHPTVARQYSNQLRNRMCRSLGADLDQLLQEDARAAGLGGNEVARLNRLQLISSSLSLRHGLSSSSLSSCSTPPRCQSLVSLVEWTDRGRSLPAASPSKVHHEDHSKQSLVPLEPREHVWLVKGAAGAWPDIYSLFREDSSLLNRGDFISGFTVLHWIAKHGDHRVLNTLWYGVQKADLTLDINARSMSGHTPLHVAAIHGHKNIIRLLVSKFNADVKLRDTAGKKAWQYLSHAAPSDIFQLLGAPPQAAWKGAGGVRKVDGEQQQRRRRRHHFSTASSGQRPLTISGMTKVKRSSSLAAFLKHKSLHRFYGHQSDASI